MEMVDCLSYHTFYGSRFGLVSLEMKVGGAKVVPEVSSCSGFFNIR